MKGEERALGDIGIDTVIQIAIHPVITETVTDLVLKGEGKDLLEKRVVVVSENTRNITSIEAETPLRRNVQKPREISTKGGVEYKVLFPRHCNATMAIAQTYQEIFT
ncbi:hypothetical protein Pyn_21178 [Prunus yedoensis var. nudiflora]|uniref:Uncharacterized protein n=1 Tax=Prunus yedoensis var. nudiflora TaxID=2094558 RepID=A0A314UM29_PRUYE|nr:hypothetical protein Pyn_21178 [Prunus yedoensis var. nudiflora]